LAQANDLPREEHIMPSSYLPEPFHTGSSLIAVSRGAREKKRAEIEVFGHQVRAAVVLAKEQIDCQASADATRFCLDEELSLLDYGRFRSGNDPVKQHLIYRKVEAFAGRNDRRLTRKFG
jgi:hypothetical protein